MRGENRCFTNRYLLSLALFCLAFDIGFHSVSFAFVCPDPTNKICSIVIQRDFEITPKGNTNVTAVKLTNSSSDTCTKMSGSFSETWLAGPYYIKTYYGHRITKYYCINYVWYIADEGETYSLDNNAPIDAPPNFRYSGNPIHPSRIYPHGCADLPSTVAPSPDIGDPKCNQVSLDSK